MPGARRGRGSLVVEERHRPQRAWLVADDARIPEGRQVLGREPELYSEHLVVVFAEAWRRARPRGRRAAGEVPGEAVGRQNWIGDAEHRLTRGWAGRGRPARALPPPTGGDATPGDTVPRRSPDREPRAAPAAGHLPAPRTPSAAHRQRSALLVSTRSIVGRMASVARLRPARHSRPLAPIRLAPLLDVEEPTPRSRSAAHQP